MLFCEKYANIVAMWRFYTFINTNLKSYACFSFESKGCAIIASPVFALPCLPEFHWTLCPKSTVEFLQRMVPNFIEPSVWPRNSPDLNPVDYAVWGALQQSVYRIPISNLEDLKNRVCTCWENLDQQIIDKSVDQWRDRLKTVVRVNGGHVEQLFWLSSSFAAVLSSVAYVF